jgi:transcriptional regulator with XRE-family HTH domain
VNKKTWNTKILSITFVTLWQVNSRLVMSFGEHIKSLRIRRHLLQREVAAKLNIDTPMLSKIERNERRMKRELVGVLAQMYQSDVKELMARWLAGQVYNLVKDEESALRAIDLAEENVRYEKRKRQNVAPGAQ